MVAFWSIKRLKRAALLVTVVVFVLSVYTTISIIPVIAYGDENVTDSAKVNSVSPQKTTEIKTKSSVDKVGLQDTKISLPKSSQNAMELLVMQTGYLEQAKADDDEAKREAEVARLAQLAQLEREKEEQERQAVIKKELESRKMIIKSQSDAKDIDIRSKSNWEESDFEAVVSDKVKCLIPVALRMEKELGINALYLMSVGINETGWGCHMAGHNNYFNWSSDGKTEFSFDSIDSFSDFSVKSYKENYVNPAFYADETGKIPDKITLDVVNAKYAINLDGSVNKDWAETVSQLMKTLSDKRIGVQGQENN